MVCLNWWRLWRNTEKKVKLQHWQHWNVWTVYLTNIIIIKNVIIAQSLNGWKHSKFNFTVCRRYIPELRYSQPTLFFYQCKHIYKPSNSSMRGMMTFVDASLWRRHCAAVLMHFPWRIIKNTGKRRAKDIVVMTVLMVLLKRGHKFSNRWQRTCDRWWCRSYVKTFHKSSFLLAIFLSTGTWKWDVVKD